MSQAGSTPSTPTTTEPTKSANGITTPTPIQPNMVGNFNTFHQVKDGDSCAAIASNNGKSLAQFYNWNPSVDRLLYNLERILPLSIVVVEPRLTTTSPGNGIATPTSIQPSMTGSCKKFHKVVHGHDCDKTADNTDITQAQLLKWNPGIRSGCKSLWLRYSSQ